ncbi:MAG: LamB/YcsF family protein [Thermodesulfobacteriota bacterium]
MNVDINCDMGESFGVYRLGSDEEMMAHITSANIACGYHGGDPIVMERTISLAKSHGVSVGAHPGFRDLVGFGRRSMELTPQEVRNDLIYQVGALSAFAQIEGLSLQHVKPHGQLYNLAAKDESMTKAICEAILALEKNLILVALSGSKMAEIASKSGLKVAREAFADRAYHKDGSLVSRKRQGSVIHDPERVAERVIRMVQEGKIQSIEGDLIDLEADTICVHGDTPGAVQLAQTIRRKLQEAGIPVFSMGTFV